MGTEKKRRWDSTEAREEGNVVDKAAEISESTEYIVVDADNNKPPAVNGAAIKAALEVAKRLSARLVKTKDDEDCSDIDPISFKPSGEKDTTETAFPEFKLIFEFEKDSSMFLDPCFPTLLHSKLQLGPSEHFLAIISDTNVLLEASNKEILDLAEKECVSVRDSGHFISSIKATKISTEKILLGYDSSLPPAHTSFLRGKLLGPQGSFLKHIFSVTNCRVHLRGKGSGHIEIAKTAEIEPLHLVIESGTKSTEEDFKEATQLCEDLVATAKADYEAKFIKPTLPVPVQPYAQYPQYATSQYPQYPPSQYPQYAQYTQNSQYPSTTGTQAPTPEQIHAQAQYYQQYQQYQQALALYYAQFSQNKQP